MRDMNGRVLVLKGNKHHSYQTIFTDVMLMCGFIYRTFNPLGDKTKILEKLDEVAAELENDMETNGWTGRTVTLKFKLDTYQGTVDSSRLDTLIYSYVCALPSLAVFTRAKSFDRWITKKADLFAVSSDSVFTFPGRTISPSTQTGKELLIPELPMKIRLIGLRVTKLKDLRAPQEPPGGIKRVRL